MEAPGVVGAEGQGCSEVAAVALVVGTVLAAAVPAAGYWPP